MSGSTKSKNAISQGNAYKQRQKWSSSTVGPYSRQPDDYADKHLKVMGAVNKES